jgi:lactoylglutathione lyase
MIKGLFETHVRVADLERSMDFYENVLGLPFALKEEKRRIGFYWIGGHNEYMLGLWEHPASEIFPQHFAFRVEVEDMRRAVDWLRERGLQPHNFLRDNTERPMVFGWMPAVAIYFEDPDGHSLEFIAPLPDAAHPELGVIGWEEWEKITGDSI